MSTEEDSQPHHPLLIDLVLKTLVKWTSSSSLRSCRLVCQKWNMLFSPRFQKEYTVKLNEYKSPEKFSKLVENREMIPFHNFSLHFLSMNDLWLENVFEICGDQMTSLSLEMTKENMTISQFRELLLFRAPNLEVLSFYDNQDGLPEEITNYPKLFPSWYHHHHNDGENINDTVTTKCSCSLSCPQLKLKKICLKFTSEKKFHSNFLQDLFKASTQLEEIYFQRLTLRESSDSDTNQLIKALTDTEKWNTLTSLHLGQIENHCLLLLNSLNVVHLKKFGFEYLMPDVKSQSLEDFLHSQAPYFEELTLNEYRGRSNLIVKFPTMEKLKKLSITAFDKYSQILPSQPISYQSVFPILEQLLIYGIQNMISWKDFFPHEENPDGLQSLRHLQAPYRMNNIQHLKRLYEIFPNIISLDITSPSNSILAELWTTWENLEVLEIFLDWNNSNVDLAFTGLNSSDSEQMRMDKSFKAGMNQDNLATSSICKLKNLKKFICETYEPWRHENEAEVEDLTCLFSDISGYHAFYHMSQLQSIYIARSDISKECVNMIKSQLPLYTNVDIRGPHRQKLNV